MQTLSNPPVYTENLTKHIVGVSEVIDGIGVSAYIILGSNKSLVIDTMFGLHDFKSHVQSISSKPFILVNTHSHDDHVGGNLYFGDIKGYLNYKDLDYKHIYNKALDNLEYEELHDHDVFDLGDILIESIPCPGHTKGSVVLLDRQDRVLFAGDSIVPHVWIQLGESTSVETYFHALEYLKSYRSEFDYIAMGHGLGLVDAKLFDELYVAVLEILENKTADDEKLYSDDFGDYLIHYYGDRSEGKRILYSPDKIFN